MMCPRRGIFLPDMWELDMQKREIEHIHVTDPNYKETKARSNLKSRPFILKKREASLALVALRKALKNVRLTFVVNG